MKVVFYKPGDAEKEVPETFVGSAEWAGSGAKVTEAANDDSRKTISAIFRDTPVVVDDGSLRTLSGLGPSMIEPGSYTWFREAAAMRGAKAGLSVRFVSALEPGEGFDPAAQYTDFVEVVTRQI